jgi:tryptophan-rich sensory protein
MAGTFWGKPRVVSAGAFVGALWGLLFASAFAIAAWRYDEANTTAMSIYALLAVLFMLIAGVHFAMSPLRLKRHRKG